MSIRINPELAERIAEEYVKIDCADKTVPLLSVGYAESYAKTLGHKLYSNILVKTAIAQKMAEIAEETNVTPEWIAAQLIENLSSAKKAHRYADVNKALELLGRYKAMFIDRHIVEPGAGRRPPDAAQAVERSRARIEAIIKDRPGPVKALGGAGGGDGGGGGE